MLRLTGGAGLIGSTIAFACARASRRRRVTALAGNSAAALPRWRDPAAWVTAVDVLAILLALSLPWSTSLVAVFAVAMVIAMGPFLDVARCCDR